MQGFSLLELMVVLALALVLTALAVPSYQGLMQRWALSREAQTLVDDLRHARAQALARGQPVSICPSIDRLACAAHADWGRGWMIFLDAQADRLIASGDTVLRQHRVSSAVRSISSNSGSARAGLTFHPNGQARAAGQALSLQSQGAAPVQRLVCISMQGRASVRSEGRTECS